MCLISTYFRRSRYLQATSDRAREQLHGVGCTGREILNLTYSAVHKITTNWSMATIGGKPNGHREIVLNENSQLRIRTLQEYVPLFLQLVHKLLKIDRYSLVFQPPDIHPISPAPTLKARLVVIKGFQEPEPFIRAVKYQLQKLEIDDSNVYIPNNNLSLPDRKALKVHEHKVVGFSVVVDKLDALDSLA
ncbi:type I-MYXAN CRISPR-associated protein Cas6/Cmx6 [Chamaesiphon sp. OTE_20_metabat_361]|uniref:type I-MYXAN CRISPR-associated protein Cas6/Cmx6 n=1 Tax=Chamaesiphon sp. OTE_20_metabat_361 TaxID=2964689 RepID=UPI00286A67CC|nr:type I-MYXAN CRISPR-associated protein Cas6/Cmx6 [Chamaesiphon sp. OTE_20_metabat_361]